MDAAELIGITPDRPDVEGGGAPHLYYYALAPSERLSVAVEDYKFSTDVPMPHRILRTYAIPFDTVASPPAFVSMAASDFPSQPTAVVTGYGWFRGYYVACIAIQPLFSQPGNSGLQFATILSLRIQKSAAHRNYSAQTVRKPDVQFEAILRNLILNYDTAVPYRTIIQNDSSAAWFNSANTYLKLAIPTDANYRLQKTQIDSLLPAMGHADPRTFQLFNRGKEIPIFVAGQNDGSFDPGDYLEFPGLRNYTNIHRIVTYQGEYNEYLNRYTDTSYYWLTYGSQNGIRCDSTTGAAIPSDTLRTYAAFLHLEKSTIVSSSQVDLTTQQDYHWNYFDLWPWGFIGAASTVSSPLFETSNVPTGVDSATIYVKLAGWGSDLNALPPVHKIAIRLNSTVDLAVASMNKGEQIVLKARVPVSALNGSSNTISIYSYPTSSTSVNWVLFDWFEIEYPRRLTAVDDSLQFDFRTLTNRKLRAVQVGGLNTKDIVLYRVAPSPKRMAAVSFSAIAPYTLTFSDTIGPNESYILCGGRSVASPPIVKTKQFKNLRANSRQIDYLALTHRLFAAEAQQYCSYITTAKRLSTMLVDVDDVFDEFGFGYPTAESIRDFVRSSSQWPSPMPSYLFLMGDASYDYKFYYQQYSSINYVPSLGYPVSDVALAVVDTIVGLPQLYVGRLPVNNVGDITGYLSTITNYNNAPFDEWNKRYLFFSGGTPDTPGQIESFKATNEAIINSNVMPAPIGGLAAHFYKTTSPQSDFGPYTIQQVHEAINNGAVFISYIGHSGTQTWDNSIGDPTQLQNTQGRFTLVSDFGCSTAKFAEPQIKSFSELFVVGSSASAIGYIGNSSLGFTPIAASLPPAFYSAILHDSLTRIGKAHLLAKLRLYQRDGASEISNVMLYSNSLVGDPTADLAVPFLPHLFVRSDDLVLPGPAPTDLQDSTAVKIIWKNFGSVTNDTVTIRCEHSYKGQIMRLLTFRRRMPLYGDTLLCYLATKGKNGSHTVAVSLDPEKRITQISREHNRISKIFQIASTELRLLRPQPMAQARPSSFTFLNPEDIGPDSVAYADLEFDLTKAFNTPIRFAQRIGRIFTTIDVSALASPAHYYWRAKVRGSNADWTSGDVAFTSTPQQFFGQSDSLSWAVGLFSSVGFSSQNGVRLQKTKLTLHLISAGFLDGQFGVIELNGANVLPSSFARGHNIAVFDSITYAVVRLRTFDVFGNPAQSDSLAAFINDIPQGAIVAAIIIDDGGNNLSAAARTAYRSVGAAQAGKIGFRDSWGIVGRKGAEPGTVLETYRPASTGRVVLDAVFYRTESAGDVVTPSFGPSSRWKSLALLKETPSGALIQSTVIGNTSDGSSDTLLARDSARTINLSGISSHKYPELTLRFQFVSNTSLQSPALRSWNLAFDPPSELATSPALIRVSKQKVNEGESQDIAATIVNAGQVRADSVRINLLSDDKGSDLVLQSFLLDSIPAYDSVKVTYRYNSRGRSGTHHFSIDVDPDTLQTEFFRFNNRASVSYTVIPDTLQPILPNLAIIPEYISSPASLLTDDRDSYPIQILIANTGSVINDSIDVLVRHTFGTEVTDTRMFRIPMPVQFDTLTYIMTVKNRAGEHLISVIIDPQNKITESNKTDNNAAKLFTVAATVIRLIQPVPSNAGLVSPLILLNPASEISDGVKSIQLQVDTLSDFSTAISRSTVMGQFTTSFDISALKHAARYWWHAKITGGPKDWTVGSFYLGDSSGSLLGQIDSAGWSLSTFAHTGFTSTSGVKILNTPGEVNVVSAGYLDGNFASISINGVNRTTVLGDTCHLVLVLDSSFSIMAVRRFHLFSNPADADSLTAFLQRLSSGVIIAAVICGEGSQNLTASVRDAYRSLGSIAIDRVGWRDAWAFIAKKGSAAITESYSPSGSGKAVADTTFFKTERSGSVTSPVIGPVSHWGVLSMKSSIPTGAQLTTMVIAVSSSGTPDTLRKSINVSTIDLQSLPAKQYSSLRFAFLLQAAPDGSSPLLRSWSVGSQTASELVLAASKVTLDKPVMQEGETCTLRATIFNVAGAAADSVRVLISSDDAGILRPVQDVTLSQLRGLDSALVTLQYDSRGKHGTHSFVLRVDPENRIPEFDKTNNTCTVSYTVIGDTLRPALDVTYDGMRVLDGDYIAAKPSIVFRLRDNNPTPMALRDTSHFVIRLDNQRVYFTPGDPIDFNPDAATVRWTPPLSDGEHKFQYYAQDIAGNSSDTTLLYLTVSSTYSLMNVFPIPNPFAAGTHFTFTLLGASSPSSLQIKIYTVAGRAIRALKIPASDVRIGFNKIAWDGRDEDGSEIANGIYFFRLVIDGESGKLGVTGKLMKMR